MIKFYISVLESTETEDFSMSNFQRPLENLLWCSMALAI